MYAAPDHRSREDAAFDPQGEGWMYRSEAFAEDVDHLLSVAAAVVSGPAGSPSRSEPRAAGRRAGWAGAFFGTPATR
jgi:hypothetical protein